MPDQFVWQKNLLHAVQTFDVVILHGNIRDLYIWSDRSSYYEAKLDELLTRLLFPTIGTIRRYDPYSKVADLSLGEADTFVSLSVEGFGAEGFDALLDPILPRILNDLENQTQKSVWLLKFMHNLLPYRSAYSPQEDARLVAVQRMIENLATGNKLLLCYLSDTQVPVEISQNAHRVTFVKIPLPEFDERRVFWDRFLGIRSDSTEKEEKEDKEEDPLTRLGRDLAKLTEGLAISQLKRLAELGPEHAADQKIEPGEISLRDWEHIVRDYKFGESQNYYQQITPDDLNKAENFFTHQEGVKGQQFAIRQTVKMLFKARTNVSALLRSGPSNAPRGVLFLCGPSGTGKTMLSKKLAKFVFSSEEAFHRIDMSEYQQDYMASRLIGSAPGYVGYEAGGILTNAMLEKPFSVVLFDEIEKAHPRIFDLFLQILSDGRLTDSRGQAVFFSEAIIVFTSNIGTRTDEIAKLQEAQRSDDPKKNVHKHFIKCVENFFRYEISRPELLNRIGNNIIPFEYLDQDEVLISTVDFYLNGLTDRFNEEYKHRQLELVINQPGVSRFFVDEHGDKLREFGGRAVLNTIDDVLLPLLAQNLVLLERSKSPGRTLLTVEVVTTKTEKKLEVRKS